MPAPDPLPFGFLPDDVPASPPRSAERARAKDREPRRTTTGGGRGRRGRGEPASDSRTAEAGADDDRTTEPRATEPRAGGRGARRGVAPAWGAMGDEDVDAPEDGPEDALHDEDAPEDAPEDAASFFARFLPVPRHLRALDPLVRMIIGDQGAGKSQLFQALSFPQGRVLLDELARRHGFVTLPLDRVIWLVGFETQGTRHPSSAAFEQLRGRPAEDFRSLWLALLMRTLRAELAPFLSLVPDDYRPLIEQPITPNDLGALIEATRIHEAQLVSALDQLEQALVAEDRYAVIAYDGLDRLSPGDWDMMSAILQGLVQWWAVSLRRWQRIRSKIFLRRDLFERAVLRGPEVARIAWNPVDLTWTTGDLYRLLFKRLANVSADMRAFLEQAELPLVEENLLAWMPASQEEGAFDTPVAHVFGRYMGESPGKGLTLRWIPGHLKDGHGRVVPRSLLRLLEDAAAIEKQRPQAVRPHLIHHAALRDALARVSRFRIDELASEELPWLRRVQRAFREHPFRVPAAWSVVAQALATIDWDSERSRPPETSPDALLGYLVDLGLVSARTSRDAASTSGILAAREPAPWPRLVSPGSVSGSRTASRTASVSGSTKIDVPDLYLAGFHLKRQGGVPRPKG